MKTTIPDNFLADIIWFIDKNYTPEQLAKELMKLHPEYIGRLLENLR